MKDKNGTSRRDFLKEFATGAVALGVTASLEDVAMAAAQAPAAKSKVILAHDANLRNGGSDPDYKRTLALLDRAMQSYFNVKDPVSPWKKIVKPGQVVGLKVNTIAGRGVTSNGIVVQSICERLKSVGIKPNDIVIWDRTNRELERCGLKSLAASLGVRCIGTDTSGFGYESEQVSYGQVKTRLSKILTQTCDVHINVPVLKDHGGAGVTLAMKNMYGVIDNPSEMHGGGCNPYVADLYMIPAIRQKFRFIVLDATTAVYDGGPSFRPEFSWQPNSILVAEDPVALDSTGWQIIEKKRAEKGVKSLEDVGRAPRYIDTAAAHGIGNQDPKRISLVELA
jgi:uncharacterized protein (DUF362 family)